MYADKTLGVIRADPVAAKASGPMPQSVHQGHCVVDIWQAGNLFHLGQPALYKTCLNLCDANVSKHPNLQPLLGFDPASWAAARAWAAMEEAGGPDTAAQVGFGAPAMQRLGPAASYSVASWRARNSCTGRDLGPCLVGLWSLPCWCMSSGSQGG